VVEVDMHEGLAILADGTPSRALCVVTLDDWHWADPNSITRAARQVQESLRLTIGVATVPPPERLRPLWESFTVSLAGAEIEAADQCFVTVPDPHEALAKVADTMGRHPRACVALGQLLRQTARLDIVSGLAAEAAVYSMLLGGPEFAEWLADRAAPRAAPVTEHPLVRLQREGAQLSVVLDHAERRNAFSFGMREALFDALEMAVLDDTIAQIELSATGPVFCSGGDLAEFGIATDLVAAYLVRLDRAPWRLIARLADRMTARLQGAAVGAGIEMAAFAGRIVAEPGTFFVLPEVNMGLVPGAGGTVSVTRRIGRWRTAWMVLTGDRVDADTALAWGLVDEIDEP